MGFVTPEHGLRGVSAASVTPCQEGRSTGAAALGRGAAQTASTWQG